MPSLHPSLLNIPMPRRLSYLPLTESGYPSLYFAAVIDGKVDLRIADGAKWVSCVQKNRFWLCGEPLGVFKCWPIGPMCVINRTSAEPPSHADCAEYAVLTCPFMTRPKVKRNSTNFEKETKNAPGLMLEHNPGVTALWYSKSFSIISTQTRPLIKLGEPIKVTWFAEKRKATQEEINAGLKVGLPFLIKEAEKDGPDGINYLNQQIREAQKWLVLPD